MKMVWVLSIAGAAVVAILGIWAKKNIEELLRLWGWTTVLARRWEQRRDTLSWQHLRGVWWLWLCSGLLLGAGFVLALWLIPLLIVPATTPVTPAVSEAPATQPSPKRAKFYSQSGKGRIVDALYELSELLHKSGGEISSKVGNFFHHLVTKINLHLR
jgi:hypothetical protein